MLQQCHFFGLNFYHSQSDNHSVRQILNVSHIRDFESHSGSRWQRHQPPLPNTSQYPTIGRKSNLNPTPVKTLWTFHPAIILVQKPGKKPHRATYRWEGKKLFFRMGSASYWGGMYPNRFWMKLLAAEFSSGIKESSEACNVSPNMGEKGNGFEVFARKP